jgi:hypothetical protein
MKLEKEKVQCSVSERVRLFVLILMGVGGDKKGLRFLPGTAIMIAENKI